MSVDQLARAVGVDRRTIYRWEQGETLPYRRQYRALAEALGWPVAQLEQVLAGGGDARPTPTRVDVEGLMASDWTAADAAAISTAIGQAESEPMSAGAAVRLAHVWLVTDSPQALHLTAGRRVGQRLAEQVTARVAALRRLDDHVGGADLHPAVVRDLTATAAVIRDGSYTDGVGRALLGALGDLCQLAGRTAADANRDAAAAHYLATGAAAAHAAGDRDLAGECLSTLSYHVANTGAPADAVLLAQTAVAGARGSGAASSHAIRLDRLAWAHAKARHRSHAERALGQAEEAYAGRGPGGPDWAYWLDADELDVMAGRCFTELGLPDLARPRLAPALSAAYGDRPREAALYLSWLVEAEVQAGDLDRAAGLAVQVLELAGRTASRRAEDRVRHVVRLLDGYTAASVAAFRQAYRDSLLGWTADQDPGSG